MLVGIDAGSAPSRLGANVKSKTEKERVHIETRWKKNARQEKSVALTRRAISSMGSKLINPLIDRI